MSEEKEQSLRDMMISLRNQVDNCENMSYDEINKIISLAYKISQKNAAEPYVDLNDKMFKDSINEDMPKLMEYLNGLSKQKKIIEQYRKRKAEKEVAKQEENSTAPSLEIAKAETPVVEEKVIPAPVVEEKKIPSPIKSEREAVDVSEVVVNRATSSMDPTEEQMLQGFADKVATEEVIQKAKIEPVKQIIPPAKHDDEPKVEMVLDNPSLEEQIIVSDSNDNAREREEENEYNKSVERLMEERQYLDDTSNPAPFEGDDDIEVEGDIDLSNVELVAKDEAEKTEREKAVEEAFSSLPEGFIPMNIKGVSRKKMSDTLKSLQKIDTSNMNIDRVQMFDFNENDEVIRKEYLKTRNDMIANSKISRIALLMSGHYEEISAYGNYDLVSISRNIANPDTHFVDQELLMFNSIYNHVKYVSYSKEKPTFEEWAKKIKYPDIASLFFGVYDANSVGDNNYVFGCPYCGETIGIARKNRDLTVAVPAELTQDRLEKFITNKDIMKLNSTEIAKWANTAVVRKQLPHSKIIVDYKVPTLYDYLVTLNTARRISDRDMGGGLDLSSIDLYNSEGKEEDMTRIMAYLYVNSIGIPAKVEGSNKFRYIKLTEKADIIEHINGLDLEDYDALFIGDKIQDMFVRTATRYYLENVECTECKKNIKYIAINPKQIFFFKIGEARNRQI